MRHHIQEILGDVNAVVMFEAVDDDDFTFSAIELQVVTNSQPDAGTELTLTLALTRTRTLTLTLTLALTPTRTRTRTRTPALAPTLTRTPSG